MHNHDDLRDYLAYQKSSGTAVVYAECKQGSGKTMLILRLDRGATVSDSDDGQNRANQGGLLVQFLNGKCAYNTALVSTSSGGLELGETAGGIETIDISMKLLEELSQYPLHLVAPRNLDRIFTSKPRRACRHAYRGWGSY